MTEQGTSSLMEAFCLYKAQIALLFSVCLVLFGLAVVALLVATPGTAGYVVSVINVVTLAVFLAVMGAVLWLCRDVE